MNNRIDKFILGTAQFGLEYGINNKSGKPDLSTCQSILDHAAQSGIGTLDTADVYGNSQEVIAQTAKGRFQILSKFLFSDGNSNFQKSLQQTLSQLGVNSLEVYSFHQFQQFLDFKDWKSVQSSKASGLIKGLGVSVYDNEQLAQAVNHTEVDVIQLPFNLLDNWNARGQFIQQAKQNGKTIHIRSVLLQGLLAMAPETLPSHLASAKTPLLQLQELATGWQISMPELALRYALSFFEINGIVLGLETTAQLDANLKIFNQGGLAPEQIAALHSLPAAETSVVDPRLWNKK